MQCKAAKGTELAAFVLAWGAPPTPVLQGTSEGLISGLSGLSVCDASFNAFVFCLELDSSLNTLQFIHPIRDMARQNSRMAVENKETLTISLCTLHYLASLN